MKAKNKGINPATSLPKVRFSIGAKLLTIITILVLLSLGSITVLVSWLVSQDLQVTAEGNNLDVNRRSATEAEFTFSTLRSNSMVIIEVIHSAGTESALAKHAADLYFARNQQIAALAFTIPGEEEIFLFNERFFLSHGIDSSLANLYGELSRGEIEKAAMGETLLLNAAPHFAFPLLALFFPWQHGGGAVIFSPENLAGTYGYGTNQSILINGSGDILIHANSDMVRAGVNIANRDYIRSMRESPLQNMQTLYTDNEVRYFGAFSKLSTGACIVITSIEYDKVFEGLVETTRRNAYLTVAVLSLSILFIWFFSKRISLPLRALAVAAQTIEVGMFEVDLPVKGNDEIGVLTNSFQKMSSALGVFGRFTNKALAVKAMRGELKPGGLPKHATIFFSDIRGFTDKSETFTKEFGKNASDRIVFWLNSYLTRMVECVEKTGGVVDKFIGDAVMAHWGTAYTSGSAKEDAFNCVRAALLMRVAVLKLNKARRKGDKGNPPITIGCGINTGIVTAGQIGSNLRMEYTVIGDPVNLASRTEALNKPLGTDILITEDTWKFVKDKVITEEMPSVRVKGKEKPVRLFAVINFRNPKNGPKTLADVRKIMGITPPDISKVDLESEEKKYKIGDGKKSGAK